MSQAKEKLQQDLNILEAMTAEMNDYLNSDVLFWSMGKINMPQLTLGGYLMRRQRLLRLRELLDSADQERLDQIITQLDETFDDRVVRFEQKAHHELEARLRQWREHLKDMQEARSMTTYATAVEIRAMIAAFLEKFEDPLYRLDPEIPRRLSMLDQQLRNRWEKGEFVWSDGWQPVYPEETYWWLYGRPK